MIVLVKYIILKKIELNFKFDFSLNMMRCSVPPAPAYLAPINVRKLLKVSEYI